MCLCGRLWLNNRSSTLLFEHPAPLHPADVDHYHAGEPVLKTNEFILMQKAPDQERHNGDLSNGAQDESDCHNDNLLNVGGTFVLNNSHYNSFFVLVKTNVRIISNRVPFSGQRRFISVKL